MVRRASDHSGGAEAQGAHRGAEVAALALGLQHPLLDAGCEEATANPEEPPFLNSYVHHFEQIRRALTRLEDFHLMPVEVPSRDVGRALAKHLTEKGPGVLLVDPTNWRELAARLLVLPPQGEDARPVLVLGPREWREDLQRALNVLNLKRDTLARHLGRPLIWCGLHFFLEATWDHAPDFWSIRNITIQIPLLAVSHIEYFDALDPFARPTRPPSELKPRARAMQAMKGTPALARALLAYARALLVHGRAGDARKPLNHASDILRKLKPERPTMELALLDETKGDLFGFLSDNVSAEGAYEAALKAYESVGDRRGEARVLGKLARSEKRYGDPKCGAERFDRALKLAEDLQDLSLRGAILHARGCEVVNAKEERAVGTYLDQAIAAFEALADEQSRARVLVTRAAYRHDVDDVEGSAADLEAALSILRQSEDPVAWVNAHRQRGHLYWHQGELAKAEAMLNETLQRANALGNRLMKSWIQMDIGRIRRINGDLKGAQRAFTLVLRTLTRDEQHSWHADAHLARSRIRHDLRDWSGARFDAEQARYFASQVKSFQRRCNCAEWHAHMLVHHHELERARDAIDEALSHADVVGREMVGKMYFRRGGIRALQGDLAGSWDDFDRAIVAYRECGSEDSEPHLRVSRAEVIFRQSFFGSDDESDEADEWLNRATKDLEGLLERPLPEEPQEWVARAHKARGDLYICLEMTEPACGALDAAIDAYKALKMQKEEGAALVARAPLRTVRGDIDGAEEDIRRATALAEELDDDNLALHVQLARAEAAKCSGDINKALGALLALRRNSLQKRNPQMAGIAVAYMAGIKLALGDKRSARHLAERALENTGRGPLAELSSSIAKAVMVGTSI